MTIDLSKMVGTEPSDPAKTIEKQIGTYKDPVDSIPDADKTMESSMPKAPDPSPFKLGNIG